MGTCVLTYWLYFVGTCVLTYWLYFVGMFCICLCPCAHVCVCVCTYKYMRVEVRSLSSVLLHIFVFNYFWAFVHLFVWIIGEHAMVCMQGLKDNLRNVVSSDLTQFAMCVLGN